MDSWHIGIALGLAIGAGLLGAYSMGLVDDLLDYLDRRR